jgi:hypothetical protein
MLHRRTPRRATSTNQLVWVDSDWTFDNNRQL